jgi:hypothetical protein
MKHDWTDGTKECWSQLYAFIYTIVLPRLTRIFSLLNANILYIFMYCILKTKYTGPQFIELEFHLEFSVCTLEIILAQIRCRTRVTP